MPASRCRSFMPMAFAVILLGLGQSVQGQTIRIFVLRSTGLFEIRITNTGGRYVVAPTGESFFISGIGNLPVRGYTDRVSIAQSIIVRGQGSGSAVMSLTQTSSSGRVQTLFSRQINLPDNSPPISIPPDINSDIPLIVINQNGRVVSRRVPLGTRP